MSVEKIVDLVLKLNVLTNQGELSWEETTRDEFQVAFPDYTVRVRREDVENQYGDFIGEKFWFSIRNDKGRIIDEVSADDLSGRLPDPTAILRELYNGARRRALGADKALEEILSSLSKKET
jgi:hypothetical protein